MAPVAPSTPRFKGYFFPSKARKKSETLGKKLSLGAAPRQGSKKSYSRSRYAGLQGAGARPQLPITAVVIPWAASISPKSGLYSAARSQWRWASIKPGVTVSPPASMTWASSSPKGFRETSLSFSPSIRISPEKGFCPVPSQILAFLIWIIPASPLRPPAFAAGLLPRRRTGCSAC